MIRFLVLPSWIWQRELAEFVQRRRVLVIKMLIPLAVAAPLVHGPASHAVGPAAVTAVVAILGASGTGAAVARERGLLLRYRLLPGSPTRMGVECLLGKAALQLLQVAPALVLVMTSRTEEARWWPAMWLAATATLVAGGILGTAIGALTGSPRRAAMLTLVPVTAALCLGGALQPLTAPVPPELTRLLPVAYLHDSVAGALSAPTSMAPTGACAGAAICLLVGLALTPLVGRRLLGARR